MEKHVTSSLLSSKPSSLMKPHIQKIHKNVQGLLAKTTISYFDPHGTEPTVTTNHASSRAYHMNILFQELYSRQTIILTNKTTITMKYKHN